MTEGSRNNANLGEMLKLERENSEKGFSEKKKRRKSIFFSASFYEIYGIELRMGHEV